MNAISPKKLGDLLSSATAQPTDRIQELASLGYTRVVPVVPPDAEISPNSTLAKRPGARGKAVGYRGADGLWRGFDWVKTEAKPGDLERWHASGAGVGVKTGQQPDGTWLIGIDADIVDEAAASLVAAMVAETFGSLPCRIGRAPKRLYVIRTRDPMTYARIDFSANQPPERVELLSEGKQFVAFGIHPGTRCPYTWPVPLVPLAAVPVVDAADLLAFLEKVRAVLPACSPVFVSRESVERSTVDQARLQAADLDMLERAIAATPNTDALFPYNKFIEMVAAIKAATAADPERGYDAFEGWFFRYDGDPEGITPHHARWAWDSVGDTFAIGAGYVFSMAAQHGGFAEQWFDYEAAAAAIAAEGQAGPDPFDLFGHADPMELGTPPAGSLPSTILAFAEDEARRKGVSVAFAAAAAVGTIGAAIGASLRIRPRLNDTGWTEPAALWFTLVAPPGSGKSPMIAAAVGPLAKLDGEWAGQDRPRHALWAKAAAAHRKAPKTAPEPGPEPRIRRAVVDDATMESLVRILAANPRGVLRAPDELFGFLGSFGAYKKSGDADRTQALRLFDGGAITIDRVGDGSTYASSALMGVLAGTQPERIRALTANLGDDGMLQRFLFVLDDGVERAGLDLAPDARAAAEYASTVRAMANLEPGTVVSLTPEARTVLEKAERDIAALAHLPGVPAAWEGHTSKWRKFLPRLVLIFHAVEGYADCGVIGMMQPVGSEVATMAARFASFLVRHGLRFYETFYGASASASEAKAIAGWLLTRPDLESVTRRDVYDVRTHLRGAENRPALLAAMGELEGCGWLKVEERRPGDGPNKWTVNPKIHGQFVQHAEREKIRRAIEREKIEKAAAARRVLAGNG